MKKLISIFLSVIPTSLSILTVKSITTKKQQAILFIFYKTKSNV